jgi:hypothetical protein
MDTDQILRQLAEIEHPILAALHPWLVAAFWILVVVTVVLAVWAWYTWEQRYEPEPPLISFAVTLAIGLLTLALSPYTPADGRLAAWCLFSMFPLGLLALHEMRDNWTLRENWNFQPFRYLFFVPPAIITVQFAIILIKGVMTIPDRVMAIPARAEAATAQTVIILNQVPEPVKNALIIAAVVLTFLAALVKFVKSLVTR